MFIDFAANHCLALQRSAIPVDEYVEPFRSAGAENIAEPRAVASGCNHSMLNPPERSIHC
jgi:hypothetical protein